MTVAPTPPPSFNTQPLTPSLLFGGPVASHQMRQQRRRCLQEFEEARPRGRGWLVVGSSPCGTPIPSLSVVPPELAATGLVPPGLVVAMRCASLQVPRRAPPAACPPPPAPMGCMHVPQRCTHRYRRLDAPSASPRSLHRRLRTRRCPERRHRLHQSLQPPPRPPAEPVPVEVVRSDRPHRLRLTRSMAARVRPARLRPPRAQRQTTTQIEMLQTPPVHVQAATRAPRRGGSRAEEAACAWRALALSS